MAGWTQALRGGEDTIGWLADRQTDRQAMASVKQRGTRGRSKQSNVYFRPSVFSVDSPSYAFSESVQAKLPQQQQCGAEYEIRQRVCVCVQQQLAVSLSGEMAAAAARHSSQLWSEMMCVFWPEEAKGSRLVCRRQPDRRWQLPFSRQAKAERAARLWLLRHFTVSTSSLPRPLMLCHWSFSRVTPRPGVSGSDTTRTVCWFLLITIPWFEMQFEDDALNVWVFQRFREEVLV